jgi:general secretion pathway protein A
MYNQFFELRQNPFNTTPDPNFLFWTTQHREALAGLMYAVLGRKGFMVLTGDAGTGKTTLLARVLQHFSPSRIQTSLIVNPTLTPQEFLEAVLLDFGFQDVPVSKAQRIAKLQAFLLKGHREGKVSALIVDEAHKLTPEVLEEIRLLGNFEQSDEKLLQIVLVGQSELDELLSRESLRQFKQRVALRISIEPLSGSEIEQYIRHRWTTAGGANLPFSAEAIELVARVSKGIPRVINVICDNALMQTFGEGLAAVEARHVRNACDDLRLPGAQARFAALAPAPDLPPADAEDSIKTLDRYRADGTEPSLLSKLAGKLGLTHRAETA